MKAHPFAFAVALALGLVVACGGSSDRGPAKPAMSPADALKQLRTDAAALQARPEHGDPTVTIQHLLVGVKGAGSHGQRSPAEAEAFAAELYARAKAGEDFDLLVKNNTDDQHPGMYSMSLGPSPSANVHARADMTAAALGDVAWRLAVGELGIAPYDGPGASARSPFGYHLIKRLK